MKKILLLSDTHSYIDERILHYVKEADEIWHAGDIGSVKVTDSIQKLKPLMAVYGNIDDHEIRKEFPENQIFRCEGKKIIITHIAGYPKKYTARAKSLIQLEKPDIFICGHSHILKVMFDNELNVLHLNPGACGIYGFHQVRTMLRFVIDADEIKDLEVIELGKKGLKS